MAYQLSTVVLKIQVQSRAWRDIVDGDGHLKNRDGKDTDVIVLTSASYDLVVQFEGYIKRNIEGAKVTITVIEEEGRYSKFYRLYVYSGTARMLAKLSYSDCHIALDHKLAQAQIMFGLCLLGK